MQEKEEPSNSSSSPSWPELLGSNHWSNLLNPLDLSLRRLILRCGDLCQVTYDAFISDPHSKYCGASRYGKRNLLTKCQFTFSSDYTVTDFLYAASSDVHIPLAFIFSLSREAWSKESNWIGYIAVTSDAATKSTGRRDIVVTWRGTIRDLEWVDVLHPQLVPIELLLSGRVNNNVDSDDTSQAKVMQGWYVIYTTSDSKSPFNKTSARHQLLASIQKLVQRYKNENLSIICVGHSLGSSLATLSAFDIVENGLSKISGDGDRHFPVCAIVFGSPQTGNKAFNDKFNSLPNLRLLHVKNKIDLIPLYPSRLLGYVDSGVELVVDLRKSPALKDSKNPSDWHNLQAILHGVAGWNGEDGEFEVKVKRSVGVVNKSCEYLKDELLIPGSWWVEKNKGMVLGEDGEWGLGDLDDDDDVPVPPSAAAAATGGGGGGGDHESEEEQSSSRSGLLCECVGCFRGGVD